MSSTTELRCMVWPRARLSTPFPAIDSDFPQYYLQYGIFFFSFRWWRLTWRRAARSSAARSPSRAAPTLRPPCYSRRANGGRRSKPRSTGCCIWLVNRATLLMFGCILSNFLATTQLAILQFSWKKNILNYQLCFRLNVSNPVLEWWDDYHESVQKYYQP